jgi:hypothetical protein
MLEAIAHSRHEVSPHLRSRGDVRQEAGIGMVGEEHGQAEMGKFHSRLLKIELNEVIPDDWLKPYNSLKMTELKCDIRRRADRQSRYSAWRRSHAHAAPA